MQFAKVLIIFGCLGPLLGAIPFFLPMLLLGKAPLIAFFFVALFSYVLGLVPALVSGALFHAAQSPLTKYFGRFPTRLHQVLLGGLIGAISTALSYLPLALLPNKNIGFSFLLFAACGAISGSICAAIASGSNMPLNPDARQQPRAG